MYRVTIKTWNFEKDWFEHVTLGEFRSRELAIIFADAFMSQYEEMLAYVVDEEDDIVY